MRLKEFLVEMSLDAALKLFSLDINQLDTETVKRQYKKLSLQHHPDRGGDLNMMKDVNDAKETLDRALKGGLKKNDYGREFWQRMEQEYQKLGKRMRDAVISAFDPNVFINYFNQFSDKKFQFKMLKTHPMDNVRNPSYAGFDGEFFTGDRDVIFTIGVLVNLIDIKNSTGLASGDIDFRVMIDAFGFAHNKKQKLSKTDYKFTNDHSFFNNPDKIYPKNKLTKIFSGATSNRAFKKRDMITYLTKKLGASWDGDYARIPLGDDYNLTIYRTVFMKIAGWGINGLYHKYSRVAFFPVTSMGETEETAKWFEDLKKLGMKSTKNEKALIAKLKQAIDQKNAELKKARGL